MKQTLNTFVENIKVNVPGFIAVAVTEIESGVSYQSFSANPNFDPTLASAYNLEVVKAKFKAIKALGLQEDIRDISITLTDQVHIIDIAPSGSYFIYLAVDSENANLGITRTLLNKYKTDLNNIL